MKSSKFFNKTVKYCFHIPNGRPSHEQLLFILKQSPKMDDKGKSTAKKISLQLKKTEANQIKASSVCEQQVRHKQAAKIPVNVCFYVR